MAVSFLETVKNYFSPQFTNHLSNSLDESSSGISKALNAIIPVGMESVLQKATSGNGGANSVYEMAKEASGYFSKEPNLSDLHNDEKGSEIPEKIFEGKESHIMSAISNYAGIQKSSASALSTMALPVIMGLLGRHVEQNNLSASGLAGYLSSQKDNIQNALPPELSSLAGIPDIGTGHTHSPLIAENNPGQDGLKSSDVDHRKKDSKWLIPAVVIILVIALLVYFSRGCGNSKTSNESPATTTSALNK